MFFTLFSSPQFLLSVILEFSHFKLFVSALHHVIISIFRLDWFLMLLYIVTLSPLH